MRLTKLQRAGGKPLAAADFLRGAKFARIASVPAAHQAFLMPRFA